MSTTGRIVRAAGLLAAVVAPLAGARALNTQIVPALSQDAIVRYLSKPRSATAARYDLKDSAGNPMHSPSIIELAGQPYRYAAVYHSPVKAGPAATRFRINLATSNDLMTWTYVGMVADDADMPRLVQVPGSQWIVLAYEQWRGPGPASAAPCQLGFRLFYTADDLLKRTTRSVWLAPPYRTAINGTPSFYDVRLVKRGGRFGVDARYGFHFFDGTRDVNAGGTLTGLFASTGVTATAAPAARYDRALDRLGVTGNIGQRDTLVTTTGRYNVQEGNVGQPTRSFDKWRIWLYRFAAGQTTAAGDGSFVPITPKTPTGSTAFGNPAITVVDSPTGPGKAIVISYFLFAEGAKPGEAGSLLYYFNL